MIVAAVMLAACGGGERDSGADAEGGHSAVAADRAAVIREAVRDDIRAAVAAGDFGPPRFIAAKELLSPCEVSAVVRGGTKPDPEAVAKVVTRLKNRGWGKTRQHSSAADEGWSLEKKGWMLTFVSGTVSEKAVAFGPDVERQGRAKPFEGLVFRGAGPCSTPSATASP
ncbi:hypothetical protein ABT317_04085 [Streptomyces carpinensis]|uniref:Lipoprotein n=1 Tax=Streptomyces carpinensis TaxID=66369 RepID=A0ABV1VXV6_9ACTN